MRYAYPGRAIPIQPFLTPTDHKFLPDSAAQPKQGQSQDAANGTGQPSVSASGNIPGLHPRGSNTPPAPNGANPFPS